METKKSKTGVYVYPGTFVDEHTFLDLNGNPYELIPSKFPPKQKQKIRIDPRTGRKKIYDKNFGWREI